MELQTKKEYKIKYYGKELKARYIGTNDEGIYAFMFKRKVDTPSGMRKYAFVKTEQIITE